MSRGLIQTTITVYTTPKQLRRIAAEMEVKMAHKRLGEEIHKETIYLDNRTSVVLAVDQDAFHRRNIEGNPWL